MHDAQSGTGCSYAEPKDMPLLPVDIFIQQENIQQQPYHVDKDNTCGTTVIHAQVFDAADSAADVGFS